MLADVQQTDLLNGPSHTFTSTAEVTLTNEWWNGNEICRTRKSQHDYGLNISVNCKFYSERIDCFLLFVNNQNGNSLV